MSSDSTAATQTTIVLDTDYQNAIRFPVWMALSVFSAICVAAISSRIDRDERGSEEKWTLAVTILSMCFSFLAVGAYLLARSLFVGQVFEAAAIALLLAIWGIGLPTIMHPEKGIAVEGITVVNANLYFFSWLSLAACVFLAGSLAQEAVGVDVRKTPAKTARWYGLCASSLVVMGSAIRIFREADCGDSDSLLSDNSFCKRSRLAIALGVVTFVASGALSYLLQKQMVNLLIEVAATTLLLAMWCFGVGYITFGDNSPGNQIGNLYFSTWISFILVVMLFASSFRDFVGSQQAGGAEPQEQQQPPQNGMESPGMHPQIPNEDEI